MALLPTGIGSTPSVPSYRFAGVTLLERESVVDRLTTLLDVARSGAGRIVLIEGEAGMGKTSVASAFANAHRDDTHVLWGGCDDLMTARPLGPIWDMASDEPDLEPSLHSGDRFEVFGKLHELIRRSLRPTLMVIEDVHWADESTLDLIKYLGRRIERTHALLALTHRVDEKSGGDRLRAVLGDLRNEAVERIVLDPLSLDAVHKMVGDEENAASVWQVSGGNPFFVTELIGSDADSIPMSIRDAVRSRVLRLSQSARELVELTSVAPGRIELALVDEIFGDHWDRLRECEEAGILQIRDEALAFRHELARRAVEGDLPETRRRELNLTVLRRCEANNADVTRCAHHARQAGDPESMIRLLPAAARRASVMESHREAVSHLRALEPYLGWMSPEQLADHYHMWAWEEFLMEPSGGERLIDEAVSLRRRLGDRSALGSTLLVASRIAWANTRRDAAVEFAEEAASILEKVGGEQLAMAYSNLSQLAMFDANEAGTLEYTDRALATAGAGPSPSRAHSLISRGTLSAMIRYPDGLEDIEEGYRLSVEHGFSDAEWRAVGNRAEVALMWRHPTDAEPWVWKGMKLNEQRERRFAESYVISLSASLDEMRGDWADAEAKVRPLLEHTSAPDYPRVLASRVLARVLARRGDPDAGATVIDAWKRARRAVEITAMGPAGSVVAEYASLSGRIDPDLIEELISLMDRCMRLSAIWLAGELAQWLVLAGALDEVPAVLPAPFVSLDRGDWAAAADFWGEREAPYERAVALSHGDDEAKLEALAIMDRLGARPLAYRIRGQLHEAGIKRVPRGPRQATRKSPFGLTPRQNEVLALLDEGLTNEQIADRLFVSVRTVENHVSAILAKLGAASRDQAVAIARQAGERAHPISR